MDTPAVYRDYARALARRPALAMKSDMSYIVGGRSRYDKCANFARSSLVVRSPRVIRLTQKARLKLDA